MTLRHPNYDLDADFQERSANDAAERLRGKFIGVVGSTAMDRDLDQALAAERRATVERIRAACEEITMVRGDDLVYLAGLVQNILDAEANHD